MSDKTYKPKSVGKIVDRHMNQWELARDVQDRSEHARLADGAEIDYITISRAIGSGGEEIARSLAEQMHWDLYDKEILNYMSENMDVHVKALESVDERTISWINDWLVPFFTSKPQAHVEQLSYYKHLGKVLLVISKHGRAVIVGRAAGQILPREKGLRVRITAPFELRCERYAEKNKIRVDEARSIVRNADEAQRRFVRDFTGIHIDDVHQYDLICNTEKLAPTSVAKLIWRALDQRVVSKIEQAKIKAEGEDPATIVERQMKLWEAEKKKGQVTPHHAHLTSGLEIDYITIARELGSGGAQIARMLSDLMKWQVYDREILDYMAQNMKVQLQLLMSVDERTLGWIGDWLVPMFRGKSHEHIRQLRYYEHLGQVLLVLAKHGEAIIVGRGAGHVLPKDKGLSVLITAPTEMRSKRFAKEEDLSLDEAKMQIRKSDKDQIRFVKDFVNKDFLNEEEYDIIFNTEKLYPTSVAKLIWRAFDQRIESKQTEFEKSLR